MLANHTSIQVLFQRALVQFGGLFKRGAFLDSYKKEAMFSDSLEEFDECREIVEELVKEYKACESPDYANFGNDPSNNDQNLNLKSETQ